jgi:hypothetical protein
MNSPGPLGSDLISLMASPTSQLTLRPLGLLTSRLGAYRIFLDIRRIMILKPKGRMRMRRGVQTRPRGIGRLQIKFCAGGEITGSY